MEYVKNMYNDKWSRDKNYFACYFVVKLFTVVTDGHENTTCI